MRGEERRRRREEEAEGREEDVKVLKTEPHKRGEEKIPPRRVFGYNSLPRALFGTRVGGNGSYQLPGAS